jgi:outer membrane protein OmpA-like peptidoglycan-associated protein
VLLEEAKVRETYRAALSAEPLRPVSFAIQFRSDSAALTSASLKMLPEVLEAVRARHSTNIIVSGHTDAVGAADYNRALSMRRARAVVDLLVRRGVSREDIEMTYHGKENPLVKTPDGTPEPRNRRVDITVR